jgi:hypothetical protein
MTEKETNEEKAAQERQLRLRRALNNSYSALRGQQATESFSSFTIEDALKRQIEAIEGEGTDIRPNKLARIDRIEKDAIAAIDQIKEIDPELFLDPDEDEDANTPE